MVDGGAGPGRAYDEQCPDGIVEKHNGCDEEHHQAGELGELCAAKLERNNEMVLEAHIP